MINPALNGATIVFDLDGTLVDSASDLIRSVNAILIEEGFSPLEFSTVRPYISRGAKWLLHRGLELAGEQEPSAQSAALFPRLIAHYTAHIADESSLFPGVSDALIALQSTGAKLVVCTSKPTDLSRILLNKLGIVGLFDGVVGIDAVTAAKPDPAHLIEAVDAVGGNLARSVMVGDSAPDARAARAAGVPLILVDFGYTDVPAVELAPDILLSHFNSLVSACTELLRLTK